MAEPLHAQGPGPHCEPSEAISKLLSQKYREAPIGGGVTDAGALLVVWASRSGSWSIVVHLPDGSACIVSSGEGWRGIAPPTSGENS